MSDILMRGHLGLGDHIITNAITRNLAAKHSQVIVLCKAHNAISLTFMWRDLVNVEVFSVKDDDEADAAIRVARSEGFPTLALGSYGSTPFDKSNWDREFYRQAGIDFQQRWNAFRVERQPSREIAIPSSPYIFVHDDSARGFVLNSRYLPKLPIVRSDPSMTANIFDWWGVLENATEIHCIDSCFAILVDSLPHQNASRLVWHAYARKGNPPHFQKHWERLD